MAGLAAARARGRKGGRKFALTRIDPIKIPFRMTINHFKKPA
jgi:hypothetical protein